MHIACSSGSATKCPFAAVILNKKQSKFNWNVRRYFRSWCRSYYAILTTLCIIRAHAHSLVPGSLRFLLFQKTFIFHFTRGSDVFSVLRRSLQTRDVFPMHFYQTTLSLPVMRRHIRTLGVTLLLRFAPGPFLRYYSSSQSHSLPMKITGKFSLRVSRTSLRLIYIPEYADDVSCSGRAPVSQKCGSKILTRSQQFSCQIIDTRA